MVLSWLEGCLSCGRLEDLRLWKMCGWRDGKKKRGRVMEGDFYNPSTAMASCQDRRIPPTFANLEVASKQSQLRRCCVSLLELAS
jgi:hypothetical protein